MLFSTERVLSIYADNSDNDPSFFLKYGLSQLGPIVGLVSLIARPKMTELLLISSFL
jgi:hypothetical protein